jgi:hypothetical protein
MGCRGEAGKCLMTGANRSKLAPPRDRHSSAARDCARRLGLLLMLSSCAVSLGTVGAAAVFILHL